jgi:hypothetical protein
MQSASTLVSLVARMLRERASALVHLSACKYKSTPTAAVPVVLGEGAVFDLTFAVAMAVQCREATVKGATGRWMKPFCLRAKVVTKHGCCWASAAEILECGKRASEPI